MSETSSSCSLHQQLRSATHPAHVRLNHHPLLKPLTQPGINLAQYIEVLKAYHRFYTSAESLIQDYLDQNQITFDYTQRFKASWLAEDLHTLKVTNLAVPNVYPKLSPPENDFEFIGLLYPLEGSTLGSRVIMRVLHDRLGIDSQHGGRFFTGYSDQTQQHWTQFIQFIEQLPGTKQQRQHACLYANHVFEQLEVYLDVYVS